ASELAGAFVSPPRCAACDAIVSLLTIFCAPCAASLEPPSASEPDALAAFAYGGALAAAITRFKYADRADLARPLAQLLLRALAPARGRVDVVVPAPLHSSPLVTR